MIKNRIIQRFFFYRRYHFVQKVKVVTDMISYDKLQFLDGKYAASVYFSNSVYTFFKRLVSVQND